jgi:methionyl-tRNA formyltransferase
MRAAFLGTPSAAVPALAALADVADVELVLTRPDSRRGRSARPVPPPIKVAALEWGIEVVQPESGGEIPDILSPRGLDLAVVVAYGKILNPETLASTRAGFLNVHFSLLPRWRGAAPVEHAILAGDEMTGVSLMVLDEGLDTGPVVSVIETPIESDETGGSLTARLSYLGAQLLEGTLEAYMAGIRSPAAQIEAAATAAPQLTTSEARLEATVEPETALRMVRAYNPRPGAWVTIDGKRLKVWAASETDASVDPGSISAGGDSPVLGLDGGGIALDLVQAEGKRPAAGADWLRGVRSGDLRVDDS